MEKAATLTLLMLWFLCAAVQLYPPLPEGWPCKIPLNQKKVEWGTPGTLADNSTVDTWK
jgi:hypothetical protein